MRGWTLTPSSRVFVAGHNGMVGSAIVRALRARGHQNLILRSRREVDLCDQGAVARLFDGEKPEVVILAAARVGGIQANIGDPSGFLYDNLMIQNNVIRQSHRISVKQFCFLGSSCIYPRESPQPMREEYLLTGPLEPTNEGYALAKIAGLKLVEYLRKQFGFPGISVIPCNLYGTNDSFDPSHSHVLSALVRRISEATDTGAESVMIWGTGRARREFMHVDDAAAGTLFFLDHPIEESFINVGWGDDVAIRELAEMIAEAAGFKGRLEWDATKPDGMPRKCMDVTRMKQYGFSPTISLRAGIAQTLSEFRRVTATPATASR